MSGYGSPDSDAEHALILAENGVEAHREALRGVDPAGFDEPSSGHYSGVLVQCGLEVKDFKSVSGASVTDWRDGATTIIDHCMTPSEIQRFSALVHSIGLTRHDAIYVTVDLCGVAFNIRYGTSGYTVISRCQLPTVILRPMREESYWMRADELVRCLVHGRFAAFAYCY